MATIKKFDQKHIGECGECGKEEAKEPLPTADKKLVLRFLKKIENRAAS